MINASYFAHPSSTSCVNAECSSNGLLLLTGKEAASCLNILSLSGNNAFKGSFLFNEINLLSPTDLENKGVKASFIVAHSYNYTCLLSSIPQDSDYDVTQVNEAVAKYEDRYDLDEEFHSNFLHLFQSIYGELSAGALYVALDLSGAELSFSRAVLTLLSKVMAKYPIIVYAPLIYNSLEENLLFLDDFESILSLERKGSYLPNAEEKEKTAVLTEILNDLYSEKEAKKEKKGKPHAFAIFCLVFSLLSSAGGIALAVVPIINQSDIAFWVCIAFLNVLFINTNSVICSLNYRKKEDHIFQNHYLLTSLIFNSALILVAAICILIWSIIKDWQPNSLKLICLMTFLFFYAALVWLSVYFQNHVLLNKKSRLPKEEDTD